MEIGYQNGFHFQAGPRKLLASQEDRLPQPAPGPSAPCRDLKSGEIVSCNNPHTLVMVLAGMSCMMFLVTVALVLLCWSVVKQRRQRREQAANPTGSTLSQSATGQTATGHTVPVDSPEYDDAVLVQLPGDEKPQFFALPKPFLVDGEKDVDKLKIVDSEVDGKTRCEKEAESEPPEAPPDDRPRL
ncbi:hypothetical protein M758_7G140600 [Ceratodon purpureus]|nr:hypothetical protein M758_7G140600 [Ceratodon purpureus]